MAFIKRISLFSLCFFFLYQHNGYAHHIIGGDMYYTYLGPSTTPDVNRYTVTLMLFRDRNAVGNPVTGLRVAPLPDHVWISIYNNDNNQLLNGSSHIVVTWRPGDPVLLPNNPVSACMTNVPNYNYEVAAYTQEILLPKNQKGYTATYQTCCRVDNISNAISLGSDAGSTFYAIIPPEPDRSPVFNSAIDVICAGKPFKLDYSAEDMDAGDSLSYTFEPAYNSTARDANDHDGLLPPYSSLQYINPYTATSPLGTGAHINTQTGIITGVAPPTGKYVVTVAVTTWRNGQELAKHRKDFIINVANCDFASALLLQKDTQCDDYTMTFSNDAQSALNKTFNWEFYDTNQNLIASSDDENPSITFPAAGKYHYKLIVNKDDIECSGEAESDIEIYPGFKPDFTYDGECTNTDVIFKDNSQASFGNITSWIWDFDDGNISSDQNPRYTYIQTGDYNVTLSAESSLGCKGSISKVVSMVDKPFLSLTNDSLICIGDNLPLAATVQNPNEGVVTWTNNLNSVIQTGFGINVSPSQTITYTASYLKSRGCENQAKVVVNVVKEVSLAMPGDTTICLTDTAFIRPNTNGLAYNWNPDNSILSNTGEKDIAVLPVNQATIYTLEAIIGHCSTTKSMQVNTVPYPTVNLTPDMSICIGQSVDLKASGGIDYQWTPVTFLDNNLISNPTSTPTRTIQYSVAVTDDKGCPKPSIDSVLVEVDNPYVNINTHDTAIVKGQPLQLTAETNVGNIQWSPATGLDNPLIPNPVAILNRNQKYDVTVTSDGGCVATSAINISVFDLLPGFYIPNAFTPNGDNLNDQLKIIAPGIKKLVQFKIYNRFGQLVFSTQDINQGWDGTYKGSPQDPAVFAWTAEGIDYKDDIIKAKGTVTIIR